MDLGEFIGVAGGTIGAVTGVLAFLKAREANRLSADSNSIAKASKEVAERANEIAENVLLLQKESDEREHSANLVLENRSPGRKEFRDSDETPFLVIAIRNIGKGEAAAADLSASRRGIRLKRPSDGPYVIEPRSVQEFWLRVEPGNLIPYEDGSFIDYALHYKDIRGDQLKQFRVRMSGMYNGYWNFNLLDICLDGTPRTPESPRKYLGPEEKFQPGAEKCT